MNNQPEILVYPGVEALQAATAERMVALAEAAVAARGRALLMLSGGSAPPGVFKLLCEEPLRGRMPWAALSIIWSDERLVPFDHPENTYHITRRTLLDHVPISSEQVFPVATYYDGEQAAAVYQQQLETLLIIHDGGIDLALLGMGPDGHTASLFPGFPQLNALPEQLVAAVSGSPKPPPERVTLTAHALNRSRETIFLVAGADKAPKVHAALRGPYEPIATPAQLVNPTTGQVTWMLDAAAAADLT
jgi:6-phosphogluconolactonase